VVLVQAAEGWTTKALQLAAQDLKLSPMFAGVCSEKDLVQYFITNSNDRLFEQIQSSTEFHTLSVPDKLKLAVRWRLEMLSPYISAIFSTVCFLRNKLLVCCSQHIAMTQTFTHVVARICLIAFLGTLATHLQHQRVEQACVHTSS
jgi:rpsU-divergently transcribed protein